VEEVAEEVVAEAAAVEGDKPHKSLKPLLTLMRNLSFQRHLHL
jgi:hypothetical protein